MKLRWTFVASILPMEGLSKQAFSSSRLEAVFVFIAFRAEFEEIRRCKPEQPFGRWHTRPTAVVTTTVAGAAIVCSRTASYAVYAPILRASGDDLKRLDLMGGTHTLEQLMLLGAQDVCIAVPVWQAAFFAETFD
jgi:hypothetical protein